jgi:ABC-type bacteriocin/lantibiotic exporter with double-glycine peptidase domain
MAVFFFALLGYQAIWLWRVPLAIVGVTSVSLSVNWFQRRRIINYEMVETINRNRRFLEITLKNSPSEKVDTSMMRPAQVASLYDDLVERIQQTITRRAT